MSGAGTHSTESEWQYQTWGESHRVYHTGCIILGVPYRVYDTGSLRVYHTECIIEGVSYRVYHTRVYHRGCIIQRVSYSLHEWSDSHM